jgi:endonuclease/exonuclease/phosphatase family metal-dependent hydrolase
MEKELVENRKVMPNYKHFAGHILCGDFNIAPGSPLHRLFSSRKGNYNEILNILLGINLGLS